MYKIQVTKNKKWFYRVVNTNNGQTILVSQDYYSRWNARRAGRKVALLNHMEYEEV